MKHQIQSGYGEYVSSNYILGRNNTAIFVSIEFSHNKLLSKIQPVVTR